MFLLATCYILAAAPPPPPPQPKPQVSNSVYLRSDEEQFQNPTSPNCGEGEVPREGNCEKILQNPEQTPPKPDSP